MLAAVSLSYFVVPLTRMSLPLPVSVSPRAGADQDVAASAVIGQRVILAPLPIRMSSPDPMTAVECHCRQSAVEDRIAGPGWRSGWTTRPKRRWRRG